MVAPGCFVKLFILGTVCLACGLLINYALPPVINLYINKQLALTEGSQSFPKWKSPPVPIYQKFYFYNVTNAQEVEQLGHKPKLEEIGPFTYRSMMDKREIDQDLVKSTMTFKHFKHWQFEPELSITDHRLQLVTLNAPLAVTLTLIQSASNAVRLLVTLSLDGLSEGFFTKRSVKQLLFEGYPDLLTTFGPLLNAEMLSQGGHFGYMNARNNTIDGRYEINTGADDISKLNTIRKFNGHSKLSYWAHHHHHHGSPADQLGAATAAAGSPAAGVNHCNSLEGASTGEMFPPITHDNQTVLKLFQPDFCRVWRLNLDGKYEAESGLKLSRFKATRDIFRNSTDLPENACYFKHLKSAHSSTDPTASNRHRARQNNNNNNPQPEQSAAAAAAASHNNRQHQNNRNSRVRHEWPAGVFTLAPCKFNAPIYMSMPHFLDADPYFARQVEGLEPDPQRHEFYVDLEPRTGSPVVLAARVQLNVAISKPPGLVRFRNVPEIMFPVFWQELTVNLTGPVIDELLLASKLAQEVPIKVSYIFFLLGVAILSTVGIFYLHFNLITHLTGGSQAPLDSSTASVSDSGTPATAPPNSLPSTPVKAPVPSKAKALSS